MRAPRRRLRQPRAAHRRPARRARAGDHDRRRLPLLRHAAAPLPARRHARPRPVHAQHGHRRVDRGRRHRPRRRAQGRRRADAPPRVHRRACCGIPHVVFAVNKMDLVDFDEARFDEIARGAARARATARASTTSLAIPISRSHGDNVVERCDGMPWYDGPPLLEHLENVEIAGDRDLDHRRFPVQWVIRPDVGRAPRLPRLRRSGRRRRAGGPATRWSCCPAGRRSQVAAIETADGPARRGRSGLSVTVRLADDLDVSRGDMLGDPDDRPVGRARAGGDGLLDERAAARARRAARVKHTTRTARAIVDEHRLASSTSSRSRTARARAAGAERHRPCPAAALRAARGRHLRRNRGTGAFILIDESTNDTVAAGMIMSAAS